MIKLNEKIVLSNSFGAKLVDIDDCITDLGFDPRDGKTEYIVVEAVDEFGSVAIDLGGPFHVPAEICKREIKAWKDIKFDDSGVKFIGDKNWGWNVIESEEYEEMSFYCEAEEGPKLVGDAFYALATIWNHVIPDPWYKIGLEGCAASDLHYIYGIKNLHKFIPGFPTDYNEAVKELTEHVEFIMEQAGCVKGWEGEGG